MQQQGWACPTCAAVMAPFMVSCVNCRGEKVVVRDTSTVQLPMTGGTGVAIGRCDICGGPFSVCHGSHTIT